MPDDTKLIFGLRTTQNVTLIVTGEPGPLAPDLLIRSNGQMKDTAIAYSNGAWTATLVPGDHVVRMVASNDTWFDGEVTFMLSAASTIVVQDGTASPQSLSWLATTGSVNDPKNPWPPPVAPEPLSEQAWLGDTLHVLNGERSLARVSPDLSSLPRKTAR